MCPSLNEAGVHLHKSFLCYLNWMSFIFFIPKKLQATCVDCKEILCSCCCIKTHGYWVFECTGEFALQKTCYKPCMKCYKKFASVYGLLF